MIEVVDATFQDGVFKPDRQPELSERTRVRLIVEAVGGESGEADRIQAWERLEELWRSSEFNSQGDRLSRDQLHERH
jgi:predicted DNA-binding antitoxin AbrB/MazE fold protein